MTESRDRFTTFHPQFFHFNAKNVESGAVRALET